MPTPLQLICTDFDGTLYSDFTEPPVPHALQSKLAQLQAQGATWVINTGRTLDDLRLGIDQAELTVHPDYVVVVEREIFRCVKHGYEPLTDWNARCTRTQSALPEKTAACRAVSPASSCPNASPHWSPIGASKWTEEYSTSSS